MTTLMPVMEQGIARRHASIRTPKNVVWPIHTEDDYDRAVEVVSKLAICPEGSLSPKDQARLDIFAALISAYDAEHHAHFFKNITVLERLRFLVEESGMSASDLGRLLGTRQSGPAILSGDRKLSKKHIRILADHFGLSTDAFID